VPFRQDDPNGIIVRFVALYLTVSIISYWIGAQDVGSFLPREFVMAAVFLRLEQAPDSRPESSTVSSKTRSAEQLATT